MLQNGKQSHTDLGETGDINSLERNKKTYQMVRRWRQRWKNYSKLKRFLCPLQEKNEKGVVVEGSECTTCNSLFLETQP